MFKYFIYKFGQFCVNQLSLKACYRIAMFLSDLQCFFSPRDRRAVKNNLKAVLNLDDDVSVLAKEVFRNFGKYLVEFFRMARNIDEQFIKQNVKLNNFDIVDKILQKGKGAIFLSAHIGNWELGAVLLSMLGYPLVAIALPHKERPVNELFNKQRESKGVKVVQTNSAVRTSIEALRSNKCIAVLADRDFTANGEVLNFLGRETLIPKGAAIFSSKTGAPIIPVFLIRNEDNTFTFVAEEPIYPTKESEDEVDREALLTIMKKYTTVIEKKIREYPTQWLMFRPFWVREKILAT